jgi:hypothetical protein
MCDTFKKGLILPDVKRKWNYDPQKMEFDLLDFSGQPIFRLNVIDKRSIIEREEGMCDGLPLLNDVHLTFRTAESLVFDGLPGYSVDRRVGSSSVLFMYCDPGVKVRFPRKSHPLMAIDIRNRSVDRKLQCNVEGYCIFERPTELVVTLDQGGRVETARDFRVIGKIRKVRFACKSFLLEL